MAALNAEIPDELKRKLEIECAHRDVSIKGAIHEAIKDWLGDGQEKPTKSPYVAKLERILASGDEQAISAVTQNVDFFYDRLRPQTKHPISRARKTGT